MMYLLLPKHLNLVKFKFCWLDMASKLISPVGLSKTLCILLRRVGIYINICALYKPARFGNP